MIGVCRVVGTVARPWMPFSPDIKRRQFDVLVCWRLDRLGRSLKQLVTLLDELQVLGVAFVSLQEGIDATTPAGKLQMHILAAIAEFERADRPSVCGRGLARARTNGQRLGRPEKVVPESVLTAVRGLPMRAAAKRLGVSRSTGSPSPGWPRGGHEPSGTVHRA